MDNLVNKVIKAKEELDILDAALYYMKLDDSSTSVSYNGIHIWLPATIEVDINAVIKTRKAKLEEFLSSVEVTNKEKKETLWKRIIQAYVAILTKP